MIPVHGRNIRLAVIDLESILGSIKKLLGIDADYTHFDTDIIMHINSVLSALTQIGIGPSTGFFIEGSDSTWTDFIGSSTTLEPVKSYVYLKVRLMFDPPSSSTALESMKNCANELEWRLSISVTSSSQT